VLSKLISCVLFSILLTSILIVANTNPVKSQSTITVPDDYPTIQEAVDAAIPGDTVRVRSGIYREEVRINESVSLIGENPETTIIQGYVITTPPWENSVDSVRIEGFTVGQIPPDIALFDIGPVWIVGNNGILSNNVLLNAGAHNIDNDVPSVYICGSNWTIVNNTLLDVQLGDGDTGILLDGSNNTLAFNQIGSEETPASAWNIFCWHQGNYIHHNNVYLSQSIWARKPYGIGTSKWDDGYPSGGNYWGSSTTPDLYSGPYQNLTGGDGICDMPFITRLNGNNTDRFPLLNPWTQQSTDYLDVTRKDLIYTVELTTNVTVANLKVTYGSLRLDLFGLSGDSGFVRITQPTGLNSSNIKVFLNNTRIAFPSYNPPASISYNDTHYFTYFAVIFQSTYNMSVMFPIAGDANADGSVDIFDCVIVALAFGSKLGDSNWNPVADINNDNIVDIFDIVVVALHFGETG